MHRYYSIDADILFYLSYLMLQLWEHQLTNSLYHYVSTKWPSESGHRIRCRLWTWTQVSTDPSKVVYPQTAHASISLCSPPLKLKFTYTTSATQWELNPATTPPISFPSAQCYTHYVCQSCIVKIHFFGMVTLKKMARQEVCWLYWEVFLRQLTLPGCKLRVVLECNGPV